MTTARLISTKLVVEDLEALFERVRAHGGRVLKEPFQSEQVPMRAGFSADPEGYVIENIESPPASDRTEDES